MAGDWWHVFLADLRRETERPNAVIRFAIVYKAIGSVALLVSAVLFFGLIPDTATADRFRNFFLAVGLDSKHRLIQKPFLALGLLSDRDAALLGVIAFSYGVLEAAEALGLALRRRWAEYLLFVATILLLPMEIVEVAKHFTITKLVLFVVNVALCVYLVRAKRLFRPNIEVRREELAGLAPKAP